MSGKVFGKCTDNCCNIFCVWCFFWKGLKNEFSSKLYVCFISQEWVLAMSAEVVFIPNKNNVSLPQGHLFPCQVIKSFLKLSTWKMCRNKWKTKVSTCSQVKASEMISENLKERKKKRKEFT